MNHPRNTVERIHPEHFRTKEKYLLYLRHVFAYRYAIEQAQADDKVLEIGCGDGYGTHKLARRAAETVAIDVDRDAVAYAAQKYTSGTCHFRHYEGGEIPFPDQTFDLVISFQVIEHVENDRHFVAEACRVLKPGGRFLLTTPNRTHRVPPGSAPWNAFHVREYYPHELESMLRSIFRQARVLGIHGDPEAQQIEQDRVRRGWSLRKLIPDPFKRFIDGDIRHRYSLENFFIAGDHVEKSLDLLGVCTR
jgi:SAM-dependent methyltransferase